MPKLPDLLAPALTVLGTLFGVALGAWWQGRSSLRLLREQSKDTWSARQHQVRHEQSMRLFDDKRAAYLRLFALIDEMSRTTGRLREWREADEASRSTQEIYDELDEVLGLIEIIAQTPVDDAAVRFSTAAVDGLPSRFSPSIPEFIDHIRYDLGVDEVRPTEWPEEPGERAAQASQRPGAMARLGLLPW